MKADINDLILLTPEAAEEFDGDYTMTTLRVTWPEYNSGVIEVENEKGSSFEIHRSDVAKLMPAPRTKHAELEDGI